MKKKNTELKPLTLPDPGKDLKNRKISAQTGSDQSKMVATGRKNAQVSGGIPVQKKSVALSAPEVQETTGEKSLLLEIYKLLVEINVKLDKIHRPIT